MHKHERVDAVAQNDAAVEQPANSITQLPPLVLDQMRALPGRARGRDCAYLTPCGDLPVALSAAEESWSYSTRHGTAPTPAGRRSRSARWRRCPDRMARVTARVYDGTVHQTVPSVTGSPPPNFQDFPGMLSRHEKHGGAGMSPEFLDGLKNFGVDADALSVIEPHSFKVDRQPYVRLKSSPSGALRLIGVAHARKLADYARRMGEPTLAARIEAAIPKAVQDIQEFN